MYENKRKKDIENLLPLNKKVNENLKSENIINFTKESLDKINKKDDNR